jgi:hypothetical protein
MAILGLAVTFLGGIFTLLIVDSFSVTDPVRPGLYECGIFSSPLVSPSELSKSLNSEILDFLSSS